MDVPEAGSTAQGSRSSGTSGLSLREVRRYFGDTHALDGVTIDIRPGSLTALVGHNGAGKSTLLRILSGADQPDSGELLLDGEPIVFRNPHDALERGVSAVYQELSMVPALSVAQNIFLGHERTSGVFLDRKAMHARATELLERFDIPVDAGTPIGELPVAQRQLIEVASAVNRNARFLLLDEPTTALEARQVDKLLSTVTSIARAENLGVLLIDHKLDEVFAHSDYIVGLANGKRILDGPTAELTRQDVVDTIVGGHFDEAATGRTQHETKPFGGSVVAVSNLTTARLTDVNVEAREGEVVALYGLMGAGRTSFLRTIAGLHPVTGGAVEVGGRSYAPKSVRAAQRAGIAYVSEERKIDGIIPNLGVYDNVGISVLDRYSSAGFIDRKKVRKAAAEKLDTMRTHGDLSKTIVALSGGNQQKALLARAFLQEPRLLLLDEPTKGVDIGAKAEIHTLIRRLARETGTAVIVVTSEEEEALTLPDSIYIFQDGTCTGERLDPADLTIADLKRLAWLEEAPTA
jgi:ABC-type sugar transport system ATPase subunit